MSQILIVGLLLAIFWSLVAARLDAWRVSPALIMLVGGMLAAAVLRPEMADLLDNPATERIVEIVLAILLFVDATEVRGGFLGRDPAAALRLLFIALPLSLACAVALGYLLLPTASIAVILLIACAVMPTDLAPAGHLLRSSAIPLRIRQILNVESGYNDGIVAPLFLVCLAVASAENSLSVSAALGEALLATGAAVIIGAVCGAATTVLSNACLHRGLAGTRTLGMAVVMAAVLAYAVASMLHGNGFVAAFVCGIAYQASRPQAELRLIEDIAALASLGVWLMFGITVTYLFGIGWPGIGIALFALAALTVLRIVPVAVALLGSDHRGRDRLTLGSLGPRGTASIVFGLLAWIRLDDLDVDSGSLVLYAVTTTVLGSVVLFSLVSVLLGRVELRHVRPPISR